MRRSLPPYLVLTGLVVAIVLTVVALVRTARPGATVSSVVVTSTPVRLLVEPLLEGLPAPTQLVPPGQGPHDFQPSPSAVGQLTDASLVIGIGGADETWLAELLTATDVDVPTVRLTELLEAQGVGLLEEEEHGEVGTDPHVWLSPKLVRRLVPALTQSLVEAYPMSASMIERNAASFEAQLVALDREITEASANFSEHRFIAFHRAFSYFARDYGLEQVAVIEEVPGEAPTPGEIAAIQETVRQYNLRGLFVEPQFSSRLVEQLSADLGLVVAPLDTLETASPGDSYIRLMERNVTALERVLGTGR